MNVIAATDLLYPRQPDPASWLSYQPDPLRYVVWVDVGRWHPGSVQAPLGHGGGSEAKSLPELAPRLALHVVCRNGAKP